MDSSYFSKFLLDYGNIAQRSLNNECKYTQTLVRYIADFINSIFFQMKISMNTDRNLQIDRNQKNLKIMRSS